MTGLDDWTQDKVPGALWTPTSGKSGQNYSTMSKPKLCLHTTETTGLPSYPNPPHLTVDVAGTSSKGFGTVWQHVDLDKGAYALRSPGPPQSPNCNAGPVLQIEMIGYAKNTPKWGDREYNLVAMLCVRAILDRGVPNVLVPYGFVGSEGYGTGASTRYQSFSSYAAFSGIHAHQHVWYNDHWDAGNIDEKRLATAIAEFLEDEPEPGPTPPDPTPTPPPSGDITLNVTRQQIKKGNSDSSYGGNVYKAQGLLHAHGYGATVGKVDGSFGPDTDEAVRAFQKKKGLSVDGIIGEKTWAALEK